jgi:hypothetical protein
MKSSECNDGRKKSIGQIVKRVAVLMVDNIFIPEHTLESGRNQSMTDPVFFRMIFPEVDKLKYVPEKLDDIRIGSSFQNGRCEQREFGSKCRTTRKDHSRQWNHVEKQNRNGRIVQMDRKNAGRVLYKDISLEVDRILDRFYLISEDDLQKIQERQGRQVPNEEL